jgi:CRISPR-associated protein Cas1
LQRLPVAYLNTEDRRIVLRAWAERRQELVAHPAVAEKIPWGLVIHSQAKLLARHLRGESPEYTAFPAPS